MGVYEKLLTVQKKLNAPKSKFNKFGGYNYRSCEDILDGVKPLLVEVGATLYLTDDIVQIAERIYVKATARFVDIDDGQIIENTSFAREPLAVKGMSDSQITGASSTYARKYALNGLFCIDDTVDEDTQENTDEENQKAVEDKKKADKAVADKQKADKEALAKKEHEAQHTDAELSKEMADSVDKRLLVAKDNVMTDEQYQYLMAEIERTGARDDVIKYAKTEDLKTLTSSKCVAVLTGLVKRPTKE